MLHANGHGWRCILLVSAVLMLLHCNPNTRYRVLSTIFDGVDAPEATPSQGVGSDTLATLPADSLTGPLVVEAVIFTHSPWAEGYCGDCHDPERGNQVVPGVPELCYDCHDAFGEERGNVHDPVGEGECGSCHQPHKSNYPALLTATVGALCAECHEPFADRYAMLHEPVADGDCVACHDPHESDDPAFLAVDREALCFTCHDGEALLAGEDHEDITPAECLDCHSVHGGSERYLFE